MYTLGGDFEKPRGHKRGRQYGYQWNMITKLWLITIFETLSENTIFRFSKACFSLLQMTINWDLHACSHLQLMDRPLCKVQLLSFACTVLEVLMSNLIQASVLLAATNAFQAVWSSLARASIIRAGVDINTLFHLLS